MTELLDLLWKISRQGVAVVKQGPNGPYVAASTFRGHLVDPRTGDAFGTPEAALDALKGKLERMDDADLQAWDEQARRVLGY